MPYDIKIYGEISNSANKKGFCGLADVQSQLEKAGGEDVRVRINSVGGDVDEGFAIYSELRRYALENSARITTLAEGRCASIATVIFLAGDERIVSKFLDPFIHEAWVSMDGNAKQLRNVADELDKTDKRIAQHYAEHTNLSFEEALTLMGADTSLKPEECVKLRFATKTEALPRPVALQKILNSNQLLNTEMNFKNKSERETLWNRLKKALSISNKVVFDADNKEVNFPDLEEDDVVEVGAMATIDGKPAEGSVVMADGNTYVFEAGILTEIIEANADSEEMAALKAENEALKAQIESLNKEVEDSAEILAQAETAIDGLTKEKETFENKAKALELKIKNANSKFVTDTKNANNKNNEAKPDVSEAVLAFRNSKFKTN